MRKVHWSVWGFLGFFGMLAVGLWIDAYWLPGVGVLAPTSVITSPLPIRQVREPLDVPPNDTLRDGGTPEDFVDPFSEVSPPCPDASAAVGMDAAEVFGGLEVSTGEEALELLPAPETIEGPPLSATVNEVDVSEWTVAELPVDVGPLALEVPPARDPIVSTPADEPSASAAKCPSPPVAASAEVEKPDADIADADDAQISVVLELIKSSGVMNSREFAPDARARAQYLRELTDAIRRNLEQDRAAATPSPTVPPPRPPIDPIVPPGNFAAPPIDPEPVVSAPSAEQVAALRSASQRLDEIANQLELHGLYPRADQVRAMAQEVRVDARKGPRERPAPLTPPPPAYEPASAVPGAPPGTSY